jgi:hypothetical protein
MRRQQSERFMTVRVNPSGKGIKTASKRAIGMDAAASFIEKYTSAVFISRAKHSSARLCITANKLRRRDSEMAGKTQDFVSANTDRLVMAAPVAGMAGIGKHALPLKMELGVADEVTISDGALR